MHLFIIENNKFGKDLAGVVIHPDDPQKMGKMSLQLDAFVKTMKKAMKKHGKDVVIRTTM